MTPTVLHYLRLARDMFKEDCSRAHMFAVYMSPVWCEMTPNERETVTALLDSRLKNLFEDADDG